MPRARSLAGLRVLMAEPALTDAPGPAVSRPVPVQRSPWSCGFTINGRFLTQRTTGVQRYAREVTRAMDELLAAANGTGRLVAPATAHDAPAFRAVEVQTLGPFQGHAWEQVSLPARCRTPLLNLCNTAPALRADQVVCLHDANVFIDPTSYGRGFRLAYRALQPLLARRAMRITSVSASSAQQLADHLPIRARDVLVLPNGHEHALRWRSRASRLFDAQPARRPFVLLLGSQSRHKNAALVLGLAEALDDLGLDLLVAGGVDRIFGAVERREAPNVRWLGVVSDDDLALLFETALCLAFPSFTEGFGLPIVEAMALGCPVVSSNRASMPEVCGSAALLASPDDAAAWLVHFAALAGSAELRRDLAGRGRVQAARFSWAASARGYLDLFGH